MNEKSPPLKKATGNRQQLVAVRVNESSESQTESLRPHALFRSVASMPVTLATIRLRAEAITMNKMQPIADARSAPTK